eukprot:1203670-Prymnesium_polylepis.1
MQLRKHEQHDIARLVHFKQKVEAFPAKRLHACEQIRRRRQTSEAPFTKACHKLALCLSNLLACMLLARLRFALFAACNLCSLIRALHVTCRLR